MKLSVKIFCAILIVAGFACTGKKGNAMPETPPDQVVLHFYNLLKDGGKIANREALNMVSTKYRGMDPNEFRKWTETYNKESKITVIETNVPVSPNLKGEFVAEVLMEVQTPSSFGDFFTSTSKVNLILDPETNEWKIDFMADTIDETDYLNAPAEATPPDAENQE